MRLRNPIAGLVNSDGSVRVDRTGGWTIKKTGTGAYVVTFNPYLERTPVVTLTAIQAASNVWVYLSTFPSIYSFGIQAVRSNDLVSVDQAFGFIAIL